MPRLFKQQRTFSEFIFKQSPSKHGKKSSIAFTKYFSKTIQQMKVNAIYLIEIEFLGTCSYALPANQHVHLITYRKTKICVISQHLNTPVDQ